MPKQPSRYEPIETPSHSEQPEPAKVPNRDPVDLPLPSPTDPTRPDVVDPRLPGFTDPPAADERPLPGLIAPLKPLPDATMPYDPPLTSFTASYPSLAGVLIGL